MTSRVVFVADMRRSKKRTFIVNQPDIFILEVRLGRFVLLYSKKGGGGAWKVTFIQEGG